MTGDGPGLGRRLRYESDRISSQHEKLNQLYADVRRELDRRARHNAFVCFGRLQDALEAHFEVEDRVYFPAVHGFRPEHAPLLDSLSADHEVFRTELLAIHRLLDAHELDESQRLLDGLVSRLVEHEQKEDALLAEITASREGAPPDRRNPTRSADPSSAAFAPVQRSPIDSE